MVSSLAGALRAAREQVSTVQTQVQIQAGLGIGTAGITLGGRNGTSVIAASHNVVQKGWRLISVDGRPLGSTPVSSALDAARRKGRSYAVEFAGERAAEDGRGARMSQVSEEAREAQRQRREADERMRKAAEVAKRDLAAQERRESIEAAREKAAQEEAARRQVRRNVVATGSRE